MDGPDGADIGKVNPLSPSTFEQTLEEDVGIAQMAQAFGCSHVEPDTEVGARPGVAEKGQDGAIVPPYRGAHYGESTEDVRMLKANIERDEAAEGGAAQSRVLAVGQGAVGAIDERLDLFDDDSAIGMAFSARTPGFPGGRVLRHAAEAGICDADEDHRLDLACEREVVCGGVGLPCTSGNVRKPRIEEVLTVVKIEDGEAAFRVGLVVRRQVYGDRTFGRLGKKI